MHVPDTGIRGGAVPDTVTVTYWPPVAGVPGPAGDARITLSPHMNQLSRPAGSSGEMTFTLPGWQEFAAAVKAGEFDGLLGSAPDSEQPRPA